MRQMGLRGVVRGKPKRSTVAADRDQRPLDLVHRVFHGDRPNRLWVAEFTYVATWKGFAFATFIKIADAMLDQGVMQALLKLNLMLTAIASKEV